MSLEKPLSVLFAITITFTCAFEFTFTFTFNFTFSHIKFHSHRHLHFFSLQYPLHTGHKTLDRSHHALPQLSHITPHVVRRHQRRLGPRCVHHRRHRHRCTAATWFSRHKGCGFSFVSWYAVAGPLPTFADQLSVHVDSTLSDIALAMRCLSAKGDTALAPMLGPCEHSLCDALGASSAVLGGRGSLPSPSCGCAMMHFQNVQRDDGGQPPETHPHQQGSACALS